MWQWRIWVHYIDICFANKKKNQGDLNDILNSTTTWIIAPLHISLLCKNDAFTNSINTNHI